MPRNTSISRILHVLIHMNRHTERVTSATLSKMLKTNSVVVRRMMSGLRDKGYVTSEKGHGGGWKLSSSLEDITLLDVYKASGEPPLFNIGSNAEHSKCFAERAVDALMTETLKEAETLLRQRFSTIKVADLARDFDGLQAHHRTDMEAH